MKILNLALVLICLLTLNSCSKKKKLPYFGERETQEVKNADGSIRIDTLYHKIPNWQFLNQDSVLIGNDYFKDKIYVADFFFTSCSTICPIMHRNLKTIYNAFANEKSLGFLSFTIDFKYDKPHVLKNYAEKLGVYGPRWQFLYGNKEEVYKLAEKSYLVSVGEDGTEKDGYIHQGYLVLIDKEGHIRAAYDGTNADQVALLQNDIKTLLAEYKQ